MTITRKRTTVTDSQIRKLVASFEFDTPWKEIDADVQPFIGLNSVERGAWFAMFLRNTCPLVIQNLSIITIDRSFPFDPSTFIGKGWSFWKGSVDGDGLEGEPEEDRWAVEIDEMDLSAILLESCLKPRETHITGEERLRRLVATNRVRLDLGVFKTLWDNQARIPKCFKKKTKGSTTFISFDGQILRSPEGQRYTLCLYFRDVGEWSWLLQKFDFNRCANYRSAVLAHNS